MSSQGDDFYQAMQDTFYLEPDDLDANRQGEITPRQQERVRGQMRSAMLGVGCLSLLAVIPALVLAALAQSPLVWVIVGGGFILLAFRYRTTLQEIGSRRQAIETDLAAGQAAAVEGQLQKKQTGRASYYLGVDDQFFLVPRQVYETAPEDAPAVIYHLPQSRHLLSVELAEE